MSPTKYGDNHETKQRGGNVRYTLLATVVALVAVVAVAILSYRAGARNADEDRFSPHPIDVTIIEQRLSAISELATISYRYTDLARHEKNEKLWGYTIPFTTSRILLSYSGEIKAGMDLHEAHVTVVDDSSFAITLPKPKVLSHSIDPSSFKIVNLDNGLFSSITIADYNQFMTAHRDSMEARAIRTGLLQQAQERAAESLDIVAAPLRDLGYHVTVRTATDGDDPISRPITH